MTDAIECDILVVGAGPGGIAAAVTAAECGRRVLLVDDNPFAGGQIWRNRGEAAKTRAARHWLRRLSAAPALTLISGSRIIARVRANVLLADTPAGARLLAYTSLILANGARELFIPFPGWTLPGVMGAGAIQALIKSGLPVAGKRVVVAGTGPLLLAVGALLRSEGADVPVVVEQTSARKLRRFAASLVRSPSKLFAAVSLRSRLLGTRYATDGYPVRVTGRGPSLRVTLCIGGREMDVDCDYLACGFGLVPNVEIAGALGCELTPAGFVRVDARLATSVAGTFAVGELTGIGGVEKAVLEGRIAAMAASGDSAGAEALSRQRWGAAAFAGRLDMAFALRPELFALAGPDTLICRCEDVPLSAVRACSGGRDAKLQTRCGMGPCQGRVCEPALRRIFGTELSAFRPPIFPTSVATLAAAGENAHPVA